MTNIISSKEQFKERFKERFKGSIVGAAVGDALGMPTEYISSAKLYSLYGGHVTRFEKPSPHHPCSHLQAGMYTDDTQQAVILAESLVAMKGFDIVDFGQRMGEWDHKCATIPGYDRFSGGTSRSASRKLYLGEDPHQTGKPTPTCGSAMRIAPLGLFYHNDISELEEKAYWASAVTHNHPAAIDSALFISHLVAYLVNDFSVEESVTRAREIMTSDLGPKIDFVVQNRQREPQEVGAVIGTSQSSYETVPMALHCFLYAGEDFAQAVLEAANLVPGDTDSIACIAGALSGAYNGFSSIPAHFSENVENTKYLQDLAVRLQETTGDNK